jgi:hypothetical protein
MEQWLWRPRRAISFAWTGFFYARSLDLTFGHTTWSMIMTSNATHVIVVTEDLHGSLFRGLTAHHRDFPEVHAQASSPKAAATRLAELLSLTLENAPSDWRRQSIQQAIAEVLAFAEEDN